MFTRGLIALLLWVFSSHAQDLYTELLKENIKNLPLDRAVLVGKGKKELITFINPDCPHCRREWQALKPHLNKLKLYIFVLASPQNPSNWAKASHIVCSKERFRALDDVLSGRYDTSPPQTEECPTLYEHMRAGQVMNIREVPYSIILESYKVIVGYSPILLQELGIRN